ncbi:MAG: O-antigen ligase family protein [Nitrospirae bacterium]|nr:O-antigen ligase family protein [Nitrospirota bacterium]
MLKTITWYSLLLCILAIPIFESPKNLFLGIASILFFISHLNKKDLAKTLLLRDARLGFVALIISSALSAAFASDPTLALKGSLDFAKMYLIFVIVSSDFSDKKSILIIIFGIIISTSIASAWGITNLFNQNATNIELNSVGHVNHSAIYLSLVIAMTIPLFIKNIFNSFLQVLSAVLLSTINLIALILSGSRAAIVFCIVALFTIIALAKNNRIGIHIITLFIIIGITITVSNNLILFQKDISFSSRSVQERIDIWEDAWNMFKTNPIIGVGAKHFRFHSKSQSGSHAHNLYLNIIAQFGMIGALSLLLLIFMSIKSAVSGLKLNSLSEAAVGALIITLGVGFLNTTMHTEHGLLFALILAIGQADVS